MTPMAKSRRRSSYHHGDLRNALLAAAVELAERDGPEAVTIRAAARKVGVTPTAAYRHFSGQLELLKAIKEEAVARLGRAMLHYLNELDDSADPAVDVVRRLVAMGRGYVRFAVSEPGLFRTAFVRGESRPGPDQMANPEDPYGLLCRGLDDLVEVGCLDPQCRPMAEFAAWSAVHGVASMLISGPLAELDEPEREQAVLRTLEMVVRGLAGGEHVDQVMTGLRDEE